MKSIYVDKDGVICDGETKTPFEDQEAAYGILYTWNSPAVGGVYKPKPDTFYQIEADWEIVDVPEYPIDHTSYPPMKKVARLKVPAPTVATDNSGEEETYDCIHCNGTGQHSKPGLVQLVSPLASPVEEEQEYLWRQVDKIFNVKWSYGMPDHIMEELKEKFILTRKS